MPWWLLITLLCQLGAMLSVHILLPSAIFACTLIPSGPSTFIAFLPLLILPIRIMGILENGLNQALLPLSLPFVALHRATLMIPVSGRILMKVYRQARSGLNSSAVSGHFQLRIALRSTPSKRI